MLICMDSMGGSVVVDVTQRKQLPNIVGVCVLDVVEGKSSRYFSREVCYDGKNDRLGHGCVIFHDKDIDLTPTTFRIC